MSSAREVHNPIFLTDADGREKFWGFAVLILGLPGALKPTFLDALQQEGYAYCLHNQGEDGRRQIIAQGGVLTAGSSVDYGIKVPNHVWTLSLAPEGDWINMAELPLQLELGFFISGLRAVLAHERREKERLLRRDLTGLFNRRKRWSTRAATPRRPRCRICSGAFRKACASRSCWATRPSGFPVAWDGRNFPVKAGITTR